MSAMANSWRPPPQVAATRAPVLQDGSGAIRRATSPLIDSLTTRLRDLCASAGLSEATSRVAEGVFRDLIVPWSRLEAFAHGPASPWVSEISDDNTPVEFSTTLSPAG